MWNLTSIYCKHCALNNKELGYLDKGREIWGIMQRIAKCSVLIDRSSRVSDTKNRHKNDDDAVVNCVEQSVV
jgi:hypothetical protein